MLEPMTPVEMAEMLVHLATLERGGVYRDRRTGWVGAATWPGDPTKIFRTPNPKYGVGRPMIGLVGPSPKDDRPAEMRLAFLDDLEVKDGPATGFVGVVDGVELKGAASDG